MATQDDYIRTALRVPPDLHAQIHEAAKQNNRTFNAEIVSRLQGSFEPRPVDFAKQKTIAFSEDSGMKEQTMLETLKEIQNQISAVSSSAALLYAIASGEADKPWTPPEGLEE